MKKTFLLGWQHWVAVGICSVAMLLVSEAKADLVGPYTNDANTLVLLHFNESAGSSVTANAGSLGRNFYAVDENPNSTTPPLLTSLLGGAGYVSGSTDFGNCYANNGSEIGAMLGFDFNDNGAYNGDAGALGADGFVMTNLNIGNGGQTPFTVEAVIAPAYIASSTNQEIICTDASLNPNSLRGFQFRINGNGGSKGSLEFTYIGGPSIQGYTADIPTNGPHAFVPNNWYHVAATYDGATLTLYWTKLDAAFNAANVIGSVARTFGTAQGAVSGQLTIGNENRNTAGEMFAGKIDEVRISSVARGPGEMQFFSPSVTISQQPVSQNIDSYQPVTFSVLASSTTDLGYQWRFQGNPIAGAPDANSYTINSVDLTNTGNYDVVITNQTGSSSTSEVAVLTVGAANFLSHRWSFSGNLSDSVGGATGTANGNATVSGGALVFDGATDTYVSLPSHLLGGLNAVTFEFWATFGTNGDNNRVFDFGNTNFVGIRPPPENYVYFSPRTSGGTHNLGISPLSDEFQQNATGAGILDGQTIHVTCVVDPPNHIMSIYTNGVFEVANSNMTVTLDTLNDDFCWLGRSLFAADAWLTGSIDEFRIYDGALSPASVAQSEFAGPNAVITDGPVDLVKEPVDTLGAAGQRVTFSGGAVGHLPIQYQWFEEDAPISGATNDIYSFIAAEGQSGHTFQLRATNNILGTNYSAVSSNATLTLTIPEAVAWLGINGSDWDTTTFNWTNGTSLVKFGQYDGVTFDSRGSAHPNVNITEPMFVTNLTVNSSSDYLLTSSGNGSLSGTAKLVKQGSGKLTIDVPNNLSDGTYIQAGTLQIGNTDARGTLGGGVVSNNSTLAFNRTDTLSVTNPISGTGQITQMGAGGVILSGSNSYSGPTVISSGTLQARNASALGTSAGGTSATGGGQLYVDVNVDIPGEPLTLGGTTPSALHKGGAGATTLGGTVALAADTAIAIDGNATLNLTNAAGISGSGFSLTLGADTGAQGTVSGPITLGAGGLTKNGAGTWTLGSLANNYSGKTVINGGILAIGAAGALGTAPASFTSDQIAFYTGGTLGTVTNSTVTISDGMRGLTFGDTGGFNVANGSVLTIGNAITGSGITLTKSGSGVLVLSGANTFDGTLNIDSSSASANDGIVRLASSGALGGISTVAIRNNNSGTSILQLDGSSGTLNFGPLLLWSGRNNLVPAIENVAGNNTFSPANLVWYAGGGTYQIQSDSDTLTVAGQYPTVADSGFRTLMLSGAGDILMNGVLQNGLDLTNATTVVGTNSLVKIGSGTATLTADNTYSGSTIISNGTLLVNGSIGGSGVTNVGGVLGGTGSINASVQIDVGASLAPGASIGTLNINGNLTILGNVAVEVSGPSSSDLANVTGTLANAGTGTVLVSNLGGALAVGNTFQIFNKLVQNGGNMSVSGAGVVWENHLADNGSIRVQSLVVAKPVISTVAVSGSNVIFNGSNAPTSGNYVILSSTNVAMPLSGWTRESTNPWPGTATFSITNPISSGSPQKFYRLLSQ